MFPVKIVIGYSGERNARHPAIDISYFLTQWPGTFPALQVKQPGSDIIYIADTTVEGNSLIWHVSPADVSADDGSPLSGEGSGQIVFTSADGQIIGKSPMFATLIDESMSGYEGEIPEPSEGWVNQVLTAASEIRGGAETASKAAENAAKSAEKATQAADGVSGAIEKAEKAAKDAGKAAKDAQDAVAEIREGIESGAFKGDPGEDGEDGEDGHSPVVTASKTGGVTTIKVDGRAIAEVNDGKQGDPGDAGHSPVVTASKSGKTTTIQVDGRPIAEVLDGRDGSDASVTASNIRSALGYKPADDSELESVKDDIVQQEKKIGDLAGIVINSGELDLTAFQNIKTPYDSNTWFVEITGGNTVHVYGNIARNVNYNLQDFDLDAGNYTIAFSKKNNAAECFIQVYYFDNDVLGSLICDSTSNDIVIPAYKELNFAERHKIRIRARILTGEYDESVTVSVKKVISEGEGAENLTEYLTKERTHVSTVEAKADNAANAAADASTSVDSIRGEFENYVYNPIQYTNFNDGHVSYQGGAFTLYTTNHADVSINGTPTANLFITIQDFVIPAGRFDLEYGLVSGTASGYAIVQAMVVGQSSPFISIESNVMHSEISLRQFEFAEETTVRIRLRVLAGTTYTGLKLHMRVINHKEYNQFASIDDMLATFTYVYERVGGQQILETSDTPICTVIDDDATNVANVERYAAACESADVRGTLATLTKKWESNEALLTKLLELEQRGHNIIIHAYSQDLNDEWHDHDVVRCRTNLVKGIQMMRRSGLGNPDFWVTPDNIADIEFTELAKQLGLTARFIGNSTYNHHDHHNRYYINRIGLDHSEASLAEAKRIADECYADGGWLVCMTHFYGWTDDDVHYFTDFVEYCKNLGFSMEAVEEAWFHKRHVYELHEMYNQR